MSRYLSIGAAAELLGVAPSTLRRWEREGRLLPDERTQGKQWRYKLTTLRPITKHGIDKSKLENYFLYNYKDLKLSKNESILNTKNWAVGMFIWACGKPPPEWIVDLNAALKELYDEYD